MDLETGNTHLLRLKLQYKKCDLHMYRNNHVTHLDHHASGILGPKY
jgi:hypothetical protein